MATNDNNFKLTVAGKTEFIGAVSFLETVRDALLAIAQVDECVSKVKGGALKWRIVDATANSPVTFELQGISSDSLSSSDAVLESFLIGLEQIDSEASAPKEFSLPAVKAIKKFAENFENGVGKVTFASRRRRYSPSSKLLRNTDSIIKNPTKLSPPVAKQPFREFGVIDGRIESLIAHNRLYFSLFDSLSGHRIRCFFDAGLSEIVRSSWRSRAEVEGEINYSPDGVPQTMRVSSITVKPSRENLPQFKGNYIDITGGIPAAEYVRGLRDND